MIRSKLYLLKIAMAKRKSYKRSRRKQSICQSQETLLQASESTNAINETGDENTELEGNEGSSEKLLQHRSPESVLFESGQSDFLPYGDLSPEIVPRVQRMKLDLDSCNLHEYRDEAERKLNLTDIKRIDDGLKQKSDAATDKCFLLEKTLSLNDEIKLDMNGCESVQGTKSFSKTRLDIYNCDTDLHSSKSVYELPCGYISAPAQFATFNSDVESQNQGFQQFLDDFPSAISACETTNNFEDEKNEKWGRQEGQDVRFEETNEKNLQNSSHSRLASNWSDCKRIFSNFRQFNSFKVRNSTQEYVANLLPKYRKFDETRSLSSFSYYTPSLRTSYENSNERTNKRPFEADKPDSKANNDQEFRQNNTRISARFTTPCSGSPPPAKRCRTILKFDDEEEAEQSQKATVSVNVNELLPVEKKDDHSSFRPDLKTPWNNCTPESPATCILDLPAVSDSGCCSRTLQELEQQTEFIKKCTCNHSQCRFKSIQFPFSKKPNVKGLMFCVWLIKKVSNVFKKSYGSIKQIILRCTPTKQTHRIKELNEVVTMLRSKNEQMINSLLEKVNHLSEEITQVRTSNVTALGALTAEVSGMQEVSRKLVENNDTLMQELKRLQKALDEARTKSPKLKPPPPPPMPSILRSFSSASVPPPPPPPPPPSFQSPAQSITPTTPNSGRNVRTPSRKCSTPLLSRPTITVEDLLKVTLKKAPQNVKENRRNTIPGPRGPVVSLDMLRSVKLKSARRRSNDQIMRSPRSTRMIKTRTAPSLSLSPIMTGADNSLGRILKQVDVHRRGPRRLLSSSTTFRETTIAKDNILANADTKDSSTQSAIA